MSCSVALWLQGVPLEQLYLYLADIRAARIQLATGGRIVSVSYEGKTVSYSNAASGSMFSDMRDILNAIAVLEGRSVRCGPIYAAF